MPDGTTETLKRITMPGVQTRLNAEEEQELLRVLREAGSLAVGVGGAPENDAFEKDFREFVGYADAVALSSCTSALELAAENDIKTIAFPAISTGAYRFPMDKAAAIAVRESGDFLKEHPDLEKVIFVCFDEVMLSVYKGVLAES